MRALSNPDLAEKLDQALKLKEKLLAQKPNRSPAPLALKRRMGTISGSILIVLKNANRSMTTVEIREAVEVRIGSSVSQDTVSSYLSVASRNAKTGVVKVGRGRYGVG